MIKIATWNLERPKSPKGISRKNALILEKLKKINADIFILTETNCCIDPGTDYVDFRSDELRSSKECEYTVGENRSTIWVKKTHAATQVSVADPSTSVCVSVKTEQGNLLVYGTIVGIVGHPCQNVDQQIEDWRRISESGTKSVCIAGDFNVQFNRLDNFTTKSKDKIIACFSRSGNHQFDPRYCRKYRPHSRLECISCRSPAYRDAHLEPGKEAPRP